MSLDFAGVLALLSLLLLDLFVLLSLVAAALISFSVSELFSERVRARVEPRVDRGDDNASALSSRASDFCRGVFCSPLFRCVEEEEGTTVFLSSDSGLLLVVGTVGSDDGTCGAGAEVRVVVASLDGLGSSEEETSLHCTEGVAGAVVFFNIVESLSRPPVPLVFKSLNKHLDDVIYKRCFRSGYVRI